MSPKLGLWAAFMFWGFAFHPPRRALLMAFVVGLASFGTGYYRYMRQDAMGMLVAGTCIAIAGAIAWAYRNGKFLRE